MDALRSDTPGPNRASRYKGGTVDQHHGSGEVLNEVVAKRKEGREGEGSLVPAENVWAYGDIRCNTDLTVLPRVH